MRHCSAAFLFVTGISLAGSEGPLFPWLNLVGVGLLLLMAYLLRNAPQQEME